MKRASGLAVLLLLGCAHAPAARQDPHSALLQMEQTRSLHAQGLDLAALAESEQPEVRARALQVIGRLQWPELVDVVVASLDRNQSIEVAAFAAGQFGLSWRPLPKEQLTRLADASERALARASDTRERVALLNALGKLGQARSASVLLAALNDPDASIRAEAALALGALARATNGEAPEVAAINPLARLVADDADAQVRYAAAYALMRSKRPEARPALTFCLKDGDARVRAVCAKGLAAVATEPELPYLLERLGDPDLQVRVEAARALAQLAGRAKPLVGAASAVRTALQRLVGAYSPANATTAMPLLALLQEKTALDATTLDAAVKVLVPAEQPEEAHGHAVVACYLAAAHDRLRTDGATPALDACAPTQELLAWREALAVRTISDSAAEANVRVSSLLGRKLASGLAAEAVDDALSDSKIDTPAVRARLLTDLRSVDWGVVLSAADAAGKLGMTEAIPELHRALTVASVNDQHDTLGSILSTLVKLHAPDAVQLAQRYARDARATVRFGALDALAAAHVEPPAGEPLPLDFHMRQLERSRIAKIETARGEIRIELVAGSFTAENFVELAERGFYDQLTFHRVVPGFVVQGGDPRGDGEGGPGYTIPCEIGTERYTRGAVGMALAGKDTGGSQFFITLTPQPHLQGRYTIFGYVSSGMDVVDGLLEGDRILSIAIEPAR